MESNRQAARDKRLAELRKLGPYMPESDSSREAPKRQTRDLGSAIGHTACRNEHCTEHLVRREIPMKGHQTVQYFLDSHNNPTSAVENSWDYWEHESEADIPCPACGDVHGGFSPPRIKEHV